MPQIIVNANNIARCKLIVTETFDQSSIKMLNFHSREVTDGLTAYQQTSFNLICSWKFNSILHDISKKKKTQTSIDVYFFYLKYVSAQHFTKTS